MTHEETRHAVDPIQFSNNRTTAAILPSGLLQGGMEHDGWMDGWMDV
jgi:hypothetical protein